MMKYSSNQCFYTMWKNFCTFYFKSYVWKPVSATSKKKKKSIHNSKFQLIDFWEKQLLAVIYMNDVIFSFSKFWVNKLGFF